MQQQYKLYKAEQARELDRICIDEYALSGFELMSRAGLAAYKILHTQFPDVASISVFCGGGNNGGDGLIVAELALLDDLDVQLISVGELIKLPDAAQQACAQFLSRGGQIQEFNQSMKLQGDVIVDALLGTGLDRRVTGLYAEVIAVVNNAQLPVISLDIPSGVHADTGQVMGCAVEADYTITFIAAKQGLYSGEAVQHCGKVSLATLDVPETVYGNTLPASFLIPQPELSARHRCAHKGDFGHVLIIGGNHGYSGAARMAGEAALRSGAGLVSIATRQAHAAMMNIGCPELMCHGVEDADSILKLIEKSDVIVIGPGLGFCDWAVKIFQTIMQINKPLIIDADALTLLANDPVPCANAVLTPHPGEAARLLQTDSKEIQNDRYTAAAKLARKMMSVVVLKGAGSLIANSDSVCVSPTGNPGMASAGFGDVLCGIIAALIAQGETNFNAAQMAVYLHGQAADLAAKDGERGLLATDIFSDLRHLLK